MKSAIVKSDWKEGRYTYVAKQSKYGIHEATVQVDQEDMDIATEWDGYKFASYKCDLQYLNEKAKRLYERYKGISIAYNNLIQGLTAEEIKENATLQKLNRQKHLAKRDAAAAREHYKVMKDHYPHFTKAILTERRRLQEWKQKRA